MNLQRSKNALISCKIPDNLGSLTYKEKVSTYILIRKKERKKERKRQTKGKKNKNERKKKIKKQNKKANKKGKKKE